MDRDSIEWKEKIEGESVRHRQQEIAQFVARHAWPSDQRLANYGPEARREKPAVLYTYQNPGTPNPHPIVGGPMSPEFEAAIKRIERERAAAITTQDPSIILNHYHASHPVMGSPSRDTVGTTIPPMPLKEIERIRPSEHPEAEKHRRPKHPDHIKWVNDYVAAEQRMQKAETGWLNFLKKLCR